MYPPSGIYNESYAQDIAIVRTKLQWGLLVILLLVLFTLPAFGSTQLIRLIIDISIAVIAVHGVNILTGYCGQITLGQAAFMGVGAYASAILTGRFGFSFWAALPCAALSAALVGVLFGLPSVRIKGFYLALSTLAAHFILDWIIANPARELTDGHMGIAVPYPQLGNVVFDSPSSYYYIIMIITIVMTFVAKNLARTGIGRAFIAIRDNDIAAESIAVNLHRYKLLAFFIGCFYAGVAGSLYAHYMAWIGPEAFTLLGSVWFIGMIIVGGMGSTMGVMFGCIFIKLLDEFTLYLGPEIAKAAPALSEGFTSGLPIVVFGVVILLFLVFEPRGIAHRWEVLKASYRLWPFAN